MEYTGRTGQRGSFNGTVIYREFVSEDGALKWEGYGHNPNDARVQDFHEIRDAIPDKWRTDTLDLDLPEAPTPTEVVEDFGNYDGVKGGMYDDFTNTDYFTADGTLCACLTRAARYAVTHRHVASRGCCCNLEICECDDDVFEDEDTTLYLKRVRGGWIVVTGLPFALA